MHLPDARLLLTGASGGIGQLLVERLCAGGARLLLVGRDSIALESLARRYPGQISLVAADLAQRSGRQLVLEAARRFGGLNGVINAAGVNQFSLLEQQDEDAIARLIGVNVTATLQLTHLLLPLLRQQPRALLVNTPASQPTAPASSPCAASPRRCAASWPTARSRCSISRRAPPVRR